jgi:hypothetical protein
MPFKNLNDNKLNYFFSYNKLINKKFNFEFSKHNNKININSNDKFKIKKNSYNIFNNPSFFFIDNSSINHEILYNNKFFGYGINNNKSLNLNFFFELNYDNILTNHIFKTSPNNLYNSSIENSLLFKGKNQYAGIYSNYLFNKKLYIESLIGYNTKYCDTNIKFVFENSLTNSIIFNTKAKINKDINFGFGLKYNFNNFIKYNYIFNFDYQYDDNNKFSLLANYNDFNLIPTIKHKLGDNCFLNFSIELNKNLDPKYGIGINLNL